MDLDPDIKEEVIRRATERLVAEVKTACNGDVRRLMVLPPVTVGQLCGLSAKQAARRFKTVPLLDRRLGIRLADYMDSLELSPAKP